MGRLQRFGVSVAIAAAVVVTGLPAGRDFGGFGIAPAAAQERQPGLLELLFNRRAREQQRQQRTIRVQPQRSAPQRQTRQRSTRSAPRRSAPQRAAPAPAAPQIAKNENATRVLVVGDFIANGLAWGLTEAFAESPNVIIDSSVSGSSGFVRDDHYDWPAEIGATLEEKDPDIVVVLIGSNDRQAMRVDGRSQDVLSDAWQAEYNARIEAFIGEIAASEAVLVWTGSPPFRFRSMSADILAFNELYRAATEGANGYFVDIWDGFVDEDGRFIERGTDINGQTVRLRNSDGINFSRAGQRKIAFYVERQLRQLLDDDGASLLAALGEDDEVLEPVEPLETEAEMVRISPISFIDPEFDGASTLMGDVEQTAPEPEADAVKSVRQMLIEDGIPPPAQDGRAGNFRWPQEG